MPRGIPNKPKVKSVKQLTVEPTQVDDTYQADKEELAHLRELRMNMNRAPEPPPPPPVDPTVVAFRQQLVPLVEKRENIQQRVRQSQRVLQDAQIALQNDQQALADTEAQIQYRLNMIAQLTGQPAPQEMPTMISGQYSITGHSLPPSHRYAGGYENGPRYEGGYDNPVNVYQGDEVNLMGNPNIPQGITSIPSPQNQRYASGYVPSGPENPRSESAVDVRESPETAQFVRAVVDARRAQGVI